VFWLGVTGMALAFFYHAPPLKFAYRGMGELAVVIAYGPLIGLGTYLVQRGEISLDVIVMSSQLGVFIALFLLINEFPDYQADRAADKRTIVTRLGRKSASRLYGAALTLPFFALIILSSLGFPVGILLGLAAVLPAYRSANRLLGKPENVREIVPAQANSLLAFLIFSIGIGVGYLIG
jgi:1,4-dihydroxy-2-naphthoate octaprenyltransferase